MVAIARTRSWRRLLAVAGADPDRRAGTSTPGFLLERGRFKPVALPPGLEDLTLRGIAPIDLNGRGQIVGTRRCHLRAMAALSPSISSKQDRGVTAR